MTKTIKNHNKRWTEENIELLKKLANKNTPTGLIAHELGRSEDSIYAKARAEWISLQPTNKPPYWTKKKAK